MLLTQPAIQSYKTQISFWMERGDWRYPLGTDQLGRDVLSRLLIGSRISVVVGVAASVFAGIIGVVLGLAAGF